MNPAQQFALVYRVWVLRILDGNNGAVKEIELPRLRSRAEVDALLRKGHVLRCKLADVRVVA